MMTTHVSCRPGGELNSREDQVEGLKRLLTEVRSKRRIKESIIIMSYSQIGLKR
jgi:hypothetical protein